MHSPSAVPYQAYRSKRHSRNVSNQHLVPNVSPPPQSRPPAVYTHPQMLSEPIIPQQRDFITSLDPEKYMNGTPAALGEIPRPASMMGAIPQYDTVVSSPTNVVISPVASSPPSDKAPSPETVPTSETSSERDIRLPSPARTAPSSPAPISVSVPNDNEVDRAKSEPVPPVAGPSTSSSPASSPKPARKVSTFRHVPLRSPSALPSSPLRPAGTHARTSSNLSSSSRLLEPASARASETPSRLSSTTTTPQMVPTDRALPAIPAFDLPAHAPPVPPPNGHPQMLTLSRVPDHPISPPPRSSSLVHPPAPPPKTPSPAPIPIPISSTSSSSSSTSTATARQPTRRAPYRPGFQPPGVYRPRTDEFDEARKACRDSGRVERTRLERRLEKLINLHFPHPDVQKEKAKLAVPNGRAHPQARRASSIFDLDFSDIRTKSAGELWRGVVQSQALQGSKGDIRAAEQTITPWEDDPSVSQCPLCAASFHPLTNRKHHCRLCGRIICSLPVKYPQRPETCSLLFVADPMTGQIEEVGEGVDYGVRRKTTSMPQGKGKGKDDSLGEDEKFLKGVRICRDCRPVLLRQQYVHEAHRIPNFAKLYEAFILLEKEIEEALPQFQELMLSLSNEERPAPEASSARKRLLEAFAQYDALSKRIRKLPCPSGPGSSQDRIQMAILTRANLFLQKNMFPLQALPKPKTSSATPSPVVVEIGSQVIDPDSEIAHALQPLLEQEALLESFVEEAKAHRKFEDAKTLKTNLGEIRAEIDRILANAQGGMDQGKKASSGKAR